MINKDIEKEVLSLESRDKIYLIEVLLSSLINPDMEIEKNWVKESEARYKSYKDGKSRLISLEEFENRMSR
jgi:putative addiction module component (TIGR02574 family)